MWFIPCIKVFILKLWKDSNSGIQNSWLGNFKNEILGPPGFYEKPLFCYFLYKMTALGDSSFASRLFFYLVLKASPISDFYGFMNFFHVSYLRFVRWCWCKDWVSCFVYVIGIFEFENRFEPQSLAQFASYRWRTIDSDYIKISVFGDFPATSIKLIVKNINLKL